MNKFDNSTYTSYSKVPSKSGIITTIVGFVIFAFLIAFFVKNKVHDSEGNKLTLQNVVGDVKYIRGDNETIVENDSVVYCGGTFYVGENSSATVIFDEGKKIDLLANCVMEVASKNSIDGGNTVETIKSNSNINVKSYTVTLSEGEAIIDITSINNNAFFQVITPDVKFYTDPAKIDIRRDKDLGATFITAERGELELKTSSTHIVKEGNSVYVIDNRVRNCATLTLEKKDAYLFSLIEGSTEELYEIYSDDRLSESNIYYSYSGDATSVDDLELAQDVYDMFDEIYNSAKNGETTIDVASPNGNTITVHIKEFDNDKIVFEPIDFDAIYESICRL